MFGLSFYSSFLEQDLSETSWNDFLFPEVPGSILVHTDTSPFSVYSATPPKPCRLQIHHHWCHREGRTPSNIAKSGFESSVCMCHVTSAEEGTVDAAEICNEFTKSQCWGGLSHMVCCRPALPPQCGRWASHESWGPWHSHLPRAPLGSAQLVLPPRRTHGELGKSRCEARAHRHTHTLQASVNYEVLNPAQSPADFINHKNDEIIATLWEVIPSFSFIPYVRQEPWLFLMCSLEVSRSFSAFWSAGYLTPSAGNFSCSRTPLCCHQYSHIYPVAVPEQVSPGRKLQPSENLISLYCLWHFLIL